MSGDPKRDDPNARPHAPAGALSGSGQRPESAPVETGSRVPKSVFAHTIAGIPGSVSLPVPERTEGPEKLSVPRSNSDAAEPLRDPSERPAPASHKRPHGAIGGTLPMPEAGSPGSRSAERMIAARPGIAGARAESGAVEVHGAAKVGTTGGRAEPTVRMPTTAAGALLAESSRPAGKTPLPAAPPPSGAPPAMPAASSSAPKSPAGAAKRDDPSVPRLSLGVEKIPSQEPATKLEFTGQSQPLSLSLDARDHVEASLRPVATAPKSMLPWIALAVVVVLGGVALLMTLGQDDDAPAAERVDSVPAEPATTPSEEAPSEQPAAAAETSTAQPATPAAVAPAPKPAPSAPAAKAEVDEPEEKKPVAKSKARKAKASATKTTKAKGPVLKVTPSGESDLEAAMRAAEKLSEPAEVLAPPEPPSAEPPSPD